MLTEEQLDILRSNNELLQLELEDIQLIIQQRETELNSLRKNAEQVRELQSKLDLNIIEFEHFQQTLLSEKQQTQKQFDRLKILEETLFQNIQLQVEQEKEIQQLKFVKADLAYTESELKEADKCFDALHEAKAELAKTKSLLELSQLEATQNKSIILEQEQLIQQLKLSRR